MPPHCGSSQQDDEDCERASKTVNQTGAAVMAAVLLVEEVMFALRKILVPTDFGAPSTAALEYALGLASALGASVTAFHAYEIPMVGVPDGTFVATPEMVSRIQSAAAEALAATLRSREGKVPLDSLLREGRPWEAIHQAAKEVGADLVVLGTHGRHGLVRALLGSVTEKVVRTSVVPVLVVHAPSVPEDPRGRVSQS
jgi:nucleotide-binding universal stress UspA family protein